MTIYVVIKLQNLLANLIYNIINNYSSKYFEIRVVK